MTDLSSLVDALKRELAVPGTFDTVFPDTSDDDLAASLADGFSEAQLQGFFPDMALGPEPTFSTTLPLSAAGGALVVLFTGMRIIRSQLRASTTQSTYKAGPVEVQTTISSPLLRDELAYLRARLDDVVTQGRRSGRQVHVLDGYLGRVLSSSPLGAFYGYEFRG